MLNTSFKQVLFLLVVSFLMFGDLFKLKKKILKFLTYLKNFMLK